MEEIGETRFRTLDVCSIRGDKVSTKPEKSRGTKRRDAEARGTEAKTSEVPNDLCASASQRLGDFASRRTS